MSAGTEKFYIRGNMKRTGSEEKPPKMCLLVHLFYDSKGLRCFSQLQFTARLSRHLRRKTCGRDSRGSQDGFLIREGKGRPRLKTEGVINCRVLLGGQVRGLRKVCCV